LSSEFRLPSTSCTDVTGTSTSTGTSSSSDSVSSSSSKSQETQTQETQVSRVKDRSSLARQAFISESSSHQFLGRRNGLSVLIIHGSYCSMIIVHLWLIKYLSIRCTDGALAQFHFITHSCRSCFSRFLWKIGGSLFIWSLTTNNAAMH
jgi:hypothetical protein